MATNLRRALLGLLTAASLVAFGTPEPLRTTTSKMMTVESPRDSDGALLINVLRTDDLIADRIPSKPLLLEKISHLLIRVELTPTKCSINGHTLPLTSSESDKMVKEGKVREEVDPKTGGRKLKMTVEMKQVQTLNLPKESPLIPLGLTSPELLKISEKYMAEGVVGAMLSVFEEPLKVEAASLRGEKLDAHAYKVTIGIQIMEIDGVILSTTDLPSIDLLELIVHPDPQDPSKVVAITTIAPEALKESPVAASSGSVPADSSPASFLAGFEANLLLALDTFGNMMKKIKKSAHELASASPKPHHRKPCGMGRYRHHTQKAGHQSDAPVPVAAEHLKPTLATESPLDVKALDQNLAVAPEMTFETKHHFKPTCLLMMFWRAMKHKPTIFLFALPAFSLLALTFAATKFAARIRKRGQSKQVVIRNEELKTLLGGDGGSYEDMVEEKKAEMIVVVTSPHST
ncbi:hypothetical protein CROQUDRAFT_132319 [Cronartium quercuum f. sp. fusiforme G11]|uniref:Uncharacterized protein n=1 Tax=Cronartium quercuum f. sp. fusiforme G11 TaxID=708437 RepID=A0A9P6NPF8_9BASI|nr:hypothetical protein CROQUDRAFT_132319 [Cronartium quercuum f. sp. fusiforme G11]